MKNIVATTLITILSTAFALGQGALSINVWPSRVDISVVPGESRTGVISVDNKGKEKTQVLCYITDVGMDIYGELLFPEGGTLATSCESWFLVNPENFFLSQGTNQKIRYTLKVPDNASGTYLASIFFHTKPQDGAKNSGSRLSVRVGTLFVINVTGTGHKDGELSSLSLHNTVKATTAQVELGVLNKGNVLIRPRGTVEIKTNDGWTVDKLAFNEDNQAVLPKSERVFRIPLANIKPGSYNLIAMVDYGGAEILSGETMVNLVATEVPRHDWPIPQSKSPMKISGKAAKPMEPAVKLSPEEIKSLFSLATKQYTTGDYQSSFSTWQKLLKADPGNTTARKNLERTKAKLDALKKIKG